ncbi:hypothetical protein DICSQDRAFT_157213 [Dichomitus squalens LYAD-421 SS1]|uniref:Uncharacterized protein n=1 Tax=Dichomitus squalens (strain LYAD-421) TaxID=732165 RepID=R7SNV2_DICSQ|nr:uncharacterized protein DICSQDRAFT_157213 [Dichomitus squalens LYAD-421 SS1]EJF57608.1 hypothetical protein DICSQDRAFT_157213 [Dichomitus squalens LYAD-421 SS1]
MHCRGLVRKNVSAMGGYERTYVVRILKILTVKPVCSPDPELGASRCGESEFVEPLLWLGEGYGHKLDVSMV